MTFEAPPASPLDRPAAELAAPTRQKRPDAAHLIALAALAVFLLASFWQIDRPGIYYDEAYWAPAALSIVHPSSPLWLFQTVNVGDRPLPLMLDRYIGALKSYLLAPGFAWFGPSAATLRAPPILLGAATLACAYALARTWRGAAAGVVAVALLATDPTFVTYIRQDYGPVAVATLATVVAALAALRWWRGGSAAWLSLAGLAVGLALYDKWLYLLIAVPAVLAALVLQPPSMAKRALAPKPLLASAIGLTVGVAPLIYWAVGHIDDLRQFGDLAAGERSPVVNLASEMGRAGDLALTLFADPSSAMHTLFDQPPLRISAWPVLLVAGLFVLVFGRTRRGLWLVPVWIGLSLLAWTLTPGGGRDHHLVPLYVLAVLWISVVLAGVANWRRGKGLLAGVVALCVVANVGTLAVFHARLAADPGEGNWSPATGQVAALMRSPGPSRFFWFLDWGLFNPAYTLADGPPNAGEMLWQLVYHQPGAQDELVAYLVNPYTRPVFVLHGAAHTVLAEPRQALFDAAVSAHVQLDCQPLSLDARQQPLIEVCTPVGQ